MSEEPTQVSHAGRRVGSGRMSALVAEQYTGTSTDRRVSRKYITR